LSQHLHPALEAVAGLPILELSAGQVAEVAQGRSLALGDLSGVRFSAGEVALLGPEGTLVAIADCRPDRGTLQPSRVLVK
jgi:tRNA pseudouridine55 synthase